MSNPYVTNVSSLRLIFPLIAGRIVEQKFHRIAYAGTGFFVGTRGLAMTAAHVFPEEGSDLVVTAALSDAGAGQPMQAYRIEWSKQLPGSDIAVFRVNVHESPAMRIAFRDINLGDDVHTTGIAECMLETDAQGATKMLQRTAKGYIAFGTRKSLAASFPLPAGMSGSPAATKFDGYDEVIGVLVGQTRSEIVEDLIREVTEITPGGKSEFVEKNSRVEYTSRIDVLAHHRDFRCTEFGELSLAELIAAETPAPPLSPPLVDASRRGS